MLISIFLPIIPIFVICWLLLYFGMIIICFRATYLYRPIQCWYEDIWRNNSSKKYCCKSSWFYQLRLNWSFFLSSFPPFFWPTKPLEFFVSFLYPSLPVFLLSGISFRLFPFLFLLFVFFDLQLFLSFLTLIRVLFSTICC